MKELKPWMVMLTVRKYLLDLIGRRHPKVIDLDRAAKEETNRIFEEESEYNQTVKLKQIELRRIRPCLMGRLEPTGNRL